MATVANKTLIFKQIPSASPVMGKHVVFEDRQINLASPPPSGVVIKNLVLGLDPYMRDRMRHPSIPGYAPAYELGEALNNFTVAEVISSDNPDFKPTDLVTGVLPLAEYAAIPAEMIPLTFFRKIENPHGLELQHFLGPLGLAGTTAWVSFYGLVNTQPLSGKTIWVNAATSCVGQIIGQLAKREGMIVIGSAGTDEQLAYLVDKLGFDTAFNYHNENPTTALRRLAPGGLDIVFDNVGGDHLQAAIANMKWFGRIILCGSISQYNTPQAERYGVRNLDEVFRRRLTIRGFVWNDPDLYPRCAEGFQEKMQQWLADGSLKVSARSYEGLENFGKAFLSLYKSGSVGKPTLKIADY